MKFLLFGAFLLASTSDPTARQRDLVRWTTHYSQKMGVEVDAIVFGKLPGDLCGVTFRSATHAGIFIGFDTSKLRCKLWTAREQALHEVCHVWQGDSKIDRPQRRHPSVDRCARRWR